jgi:hypothetical protein
VTLNTKSFPEFIRGHLRAEFQMVIGALGTHPYVTVFWKRNLSRPPTQFDGSGPDAVGHRHRQVAGCHVHTLGARAEAGQLRGSRLSSATTQAMFNLAVAVAAVNSF